MKRLRHLALPGLAALLLAPAALAHVDVQPSLVEPRSNPLLTFTVPNDEGSETITSFSVTLPRGWGIASFEAKSGWSVRKAGLAITWSGGRIPPGGYVSFALRVVIAGPAEGIARLPAVESYANGEALRVPLQILVEPKAEPSAPASGRDEGSRTLGKAALGVAVAAFALALGAGFLGLWLWLRRGD